MMTKHLSIQAPPLNAAMLLDFLWNKRQTLSNDEELWLKQAADIASALIYRLRKTSESFSALLMLNKVSKISAGEMSMDCEDVFLLFAENLQLAERLLSIAEDISNT